jgi:hypothetical protein
MDLAETFENLDLVQVDDYLARRQEEHLHLDFKLIKSASFASADDRRNFAKVLSGFANSAGGIIIWGIHARKNDQGIDCAVGSREIQPLKLLVSRLNEFTGQAVSPIVDGIKHKEIARAPDVGFAATLVPESHSPPHMAKFGEDRYYKRSGDSFYKMEHFDLEDMFGRRQKARLEILPERGKAEGGVEEITVRLVNIGRAVARHSGFIMRFENAEIEDLDSQMENVTALNAGRAVMQYTHDIGVIHPNGIRTNLGSVKLRRKDPTAPIKAHATIYCEGTAAVDRFFELSPVG